MHMQIASLIYIYGDDDGDDDDDDDDDDIVMMMMMIWCLTSLLTLYK